jgi:hypothetical protein
MAGYSVRPKANSSNPWRLSVAGQMSGWAVSVSVPKAGYSGPSAKVGDGREDTVSAGRGQGAARGELLPRASQSPSGKFWFTRRALLRGGGA